VWIRELRAPFLLLPVIFVPVAVAMAWADGSLNLLTALLTLAGVASLHASVNVLNDYFDFRSGIDLATPRTPFSGGSGILPGGELGPRSVLLAGILFLGIGLGVGTYFLYRFAFNPLLFGILAMAGLSVATYSNFLSRWGLGELVVGMNFGPLLVLGTYYVQTGKTDLGPALVGLALGVLVAGILYINEFPDTTADEEKGRRHLVARWGKAKAAERFKLLVATAFAIIVVGIAVRAITPFALISLFAVPKAWGAAAVLGKNYDKVGELIPGMASMVMATIQTGLLLLASYVLQGVVFPA